MGTVFRPKRAKLSSLKRWLAESAGKEQGAVQVNQCAEDILKSKAKTVSLLPVGIIAVEGEFKKGDIIKILNERKENLGYGVAGYDAGKAREFMGKKGKKELVHYNYLFIQE